MKKLIVLIFAVMCSFIFIENTQALSFDLVSDNVLIMANNTSENCKSVLGDPNKSDSFAHLLQDIFDLIKFATPVLVLALTIIEYTKAVVSSDKDILAKATKVTIKRLILGLCLFMVPVLLNFVFELLGWYGTTCGIS